MSRTTPAITAMLYATVDSFDERQGASKLALDYCAAANASLTGFLLNLDANAPLSAQGRSRSDIAQDDVRRNERNNANARGLAAAAEQRGVAFGTVTSIDHSHGIAGCVADHARLHDLAIIGTSQAGMMSDRQIAEHLLFESGRPILIAPENWTGPLDSKCIAVAWDNSRVAARALSDALRVLPQVDEVILLIIGDEKQIFTSIDDESMGKLISRRGVAARVEHRLLEGRSIGEALQEEARALGAGILVMGGYGHSRLRDFVLGGATVSVLSGPQLPVLLAH